VLLCLPTAPALPPGENGNFGMSPIYGQLSDKPLLAFAHSHGVLDVEHNRDREIKRRAPSCRPARVSDRQFPDFRSWIGGFSAPVSAHLFRISVSACRRPVRYATEPGLQSRVSRVTRDVGMKSAASKHSYCKEPDALLLLDPRTRQRLGEAGDREIRRRGPIDDRRNDAGRNEGEWCDWSNIT